MADCMTHFSIIEDPRIEQCKKHKCRKRFIELPNGIPCHDTIARVMARLEPNMLQQLRH